MLIKLWDWEKKWTCSQVFEGHTHYVMQIVINPKDNNQFASASLDRTIKVHLVKVLHLLYAHNDVMCVCLIYVYVCWLNEYIHTYIAFSTLSSVVP